MKYSTMSLLCDIRHEWGADKRCCVLCKYDSYWCSKCTHLTCTKTDSSKWIKICSIIEIHFMYLISLY